MFEWILGVVGATGFLALIGIILKWLVSAMGKHVDRMGKHVDNIEVSFNSQSERLISSIDRVHDALDTHITEEADAHGGINRRLDAGDKFNTILLERVTKIDAKIDEHHSHGGNGVS